MSPILGVDPGAKGAACLRIPGTPTAPICWWTWTDVVAGYRLRSPDGIVTLPTQHDVGARIAADVLRLGPPVPCVLEGLFAANQSSIVVAERAGELLGGLRPCLVGQPLRPLAVDRRRGHVGWRRQVLGLPDNTPAARAEAYAVERARRAGWLPRVGGTHAEEGALAEAGWMAEMPWPDRDCPSPATPKRKAG
jgi:hypothetical protein